MSERETDPSAPRIVHQDSGFVVVDKPAGWSTQAPPGGTSVETFVRDQLTSNPLTSNPLTSNPLTRDRNYAVAVHRLDRATRGLVIIATQKKVARLLSEQFASGKVRKTYHALVQGRYQVASGDEPDLWIDYIRKLPDQPQVEIVPQESAATGNSSIKKSETLVEVHSYDEAANQTLLVMRPLTGRMHQLRVAAAHRGHPIQGDVRYGADSESDRNSDTDHATAMESLDSIALEAISLTFHHPKTGRQMTVDINDPSRIQT